jgi:hypothetical protein
MTGYTCYKNLLRKGHARFNTGTATRAAVKSLTRIVEGVGDILFMDSFFFSSYLFNYLLTRGINCCGTVTQNHKGKPRSFDNKTLKLKQTDTGARMRGNLTAVIWRDKQDVHILTNMHR